MKTTNQLPAELIKARNLYEAAEQAQENALAEYHALQERIDIFRGQMQATTETIAELTRHRKETENAVAQGKADMSAVVETGRQIADFTQQIESFKNVISAIEITLAEKETGVNQAKQACYNRKSNFLSAIYEHAIQEIIPQLRLIFAVERAAFAGSQSDSNHILRDMREAANIRDLSDQDEIIATVYGYSR